MPVSETTNVLVKLGMLLFAFPLVALALNLLVSLITLIGVGMFALAKGAALGSWLVALAKSGALLITFKLFVASQIFWLALLPIIGFVLWASAFAKKSPFLLAALLPAGLLVMDKALQNYAGINLQIINAFSRYGDFLIATGDFFDITKNGEGYGGFLPQLLLAIGIGSVFVVSAIWLRNNRYEI
jgi:ABC-2 type transport system permease protein